jgi:hypothetical protein
VTGTYPAGPDAAGGPKSVRRGFFLLAGAAALLIVCGGGELAAKPRAEPAPSDSCQAAALRAERELNLPPALLSAIALVESGRADSRSGAMVPWPWSVQAEGETRYFTTQYEAVTAVQDLLARGVRLVDVGCLQVNLFHHPDAFASVEEAFQPLANARYAARFLRRLYAASGDWAVAVGHYHSTTAARAETYRTRVMARWSGAPAPVPPRDPALERQERLVQAWAAVRPGAGPDAGKRTVAEHKAERLVEVWAQSRGVTGTALPAGHRARPPLETAEALR